MPTLPAFDVDKNVCHNPHVVILGAGASMAAAPHGDKHGLRLPSLQNVADIIGITDLITQCQSAYGPLGSGFEEIYSNLISCGKAQREVNQIDQAVRAYFAKLQLPEHLTAYDYLILGLREKDAIFTFNWDPFLLQAYFRCSGTAKLPNIYFLHGNVGIGVCETCKIKGNAGCSCQKCGQPLSDVDLLYPVKQKNYAANALLQNEWKALADYIGSAYFITIFGYSAPVTDVEARSRFINAFRTNPSREFAEVEIIDIRDRADIERTWEDFFFEHHYGVFPDITHSQIYRHFRRSCDAFAMASLQCNPVPEHSPHNIPDLEGLKGFAGLLHDEERLQLKFWRNHKNPFGPSADTEKTS